MEIVKEKNIISRSQGRIRKTKSEQDQYALYMDIKLSTEEK